LALPLLWWVGKEATMRTTHSPSLFARLVRRSLVVAALAAAPGCATTQPCSADRCELRPTLASLARTPHMPPPCPKCREEPAAPPAVAVVSAIDSRFDHHDASLGRGRR
jgi:hypothetical protein